MHGFGAVFGSHWCYGEWPKEWLGQNIAILEFYPIVLSLMLWGDHIRDRCITFFTDTKTFYITEMLKGYGKIGYKLDSRLPITLPILVRIMKGLDTFCVSQYELFMFKAMCAMAFFAFRRIGEITVSKRDSVNGNFLQLDQVSKKHSGNGNVVSLIITLTSYKHN